MELRKNRILIGAPCPGGVDVEANGCAVDGDILGVSGPQNPKNSSIWIEKRLRNGSGTARETAEFRPHPRPALLLEVINDRGESHFHRTRHRGGPALPTPGCPEGRFVSRVRFGGRPSRSHANGALKKISIRYIRIYIFTGHHGLQGISVLGYFLLYTVYVEICTAVSFPCSEN